MTTGTCIPLVDPRLQPHGNVFARKLRLICDDTRNFFASQQEEDKKDDKRPSSTYETEVRARSGEGGPKPRKPNDTIIGNAQRKVRIFL